MRTLTDTLKTAQQAESIDALCKIVLMTASDEWVSPTGHSDPDSAWINEANAYDGDTGTHATSDCGDEAATYLELHPTSAILCDSARIYASSYSGSMGSELDPDLDIDFHYEGAWHNIFSGSITKKTWTTKTNAAGTKLVTKARIKYNNMGWGDGCREGYIYGFDFFGYTTTIYNRTRILDINHPEEPYTQKAELVLDNSDGALTELDLKGFKGVISYGAVGTAGEEYSACAPLTVIGQTFNSSPGKLDCTLSLVGIPNLMAEDKASESYMPDEDDNKTVKTLINQIVGATLDCYSHCTAYEVVWEDGYDGLADTYKPKDSFRIYVGGSRLAAFRRLLDYTGNVARVEADGKWHIFKPVVSGGTYDSEYSLESGHTFFSKAYRKTLVIPNYIVVKSQPDDEPQYSGYAQDDESYALLRKRDYKQMRLESDDQADDIAEAILSKHQLWSKMGAADIPMNVGTEVFDYVKITDEREEDERIGNIGHLTRHWNTKKGEWRMTFSFGNWLSVRKVLEGLGITGDELEEYFTRLWVKDLYAENISADQILANTITANEIAALTITANEIAANAITAAKIKAGEITANKLSFAAFDIYENDLDDIDNGSTYKKLRTTDISAGHIKLTSYVVADGEWYNESGIILDAAEGLFIDGLALIFVDGALTDIKGWVYGDNTLGFLVVAEDESLTLGASGTGTNDLILAPDDDIIFKTDSEPDTDSLYDIGDDAKRFLNGYFDNLPASPIPTSNSALDVIKKIKAPQKIENGKYGNRHYFKNEDMPDEMKCEVMEKEKVKPVYEIQEFLNEQGKKRRRRVLIKPATVKLVPTGRKENEYLRTIGVLVEAVRELTERVEALEVK